MIKKTVNKISNIINNLPLLFRTLNKIHRTGGYTTINFAQINYGQTLKGKNILITGGSSGIGFNIAKKCIQEGAKVVITGRNNNKLLEADKAIDSPLLKTLLWDISNVALIQDKLDEVKSLFAGDVDILVNNAGILNTVQFPNITEDIWDNLYATNSKGLFFLTQTLCEQWMREEKNQIRKVINISSQGGFVGATFPYRLTKWDVAGLTQGLGIKLAPHGIIVNGIAPGIIATDMQQGCLNQNENVFYPQNPMQRFALPEEIAELAIFMMSNACNFIVGQTIVCDGGYSIK